MNAFKTTMLAGMLFATAGQAALVHAQTPTLEQRVKALEDAQKSPSAPHPKSGTKNVNLQIDGHVNQAALYWNDGKRDYLNYVDGNASHSRVRFTGSGKIDNMSAAAVRIEIGLDQNSSTAVNQTSRRTGEDTFDIRKVEVWYRNEAFGQVYLGQGDMASNDTSHADLSGTALAGNSTPADVAGGVFFRMPGGALSTVQIKTVFDDLDGQSRKERIRYDSPTIAGFTLSASHSGQGQYDVALVNTSDVGGFKVSVAGAYSRDTAAKRDLFNGSGSILHVPTGLNVTVAGGQRSSDASGSLDPSFYYAKVGYQTGWLKAGKTAISADYYHSEDFAAAGDEATGWSLAVVQKIDVAAMEAYVSYHNYDYKQIGTDFDQVDAVMAGARVKF